MKTRARSGMQWALSTLATYVTSAAGVACGGSEPPAVVAPAPMPSVSAAPAPAPSASAPVDPTVLTAEQKSRDAARAGLATAVVDAYPNWNGFFSTLAANYSPDGKKILFGSTRDGVPEIYLGDVAKPGDAPVAITKGPERSIWATFTRDGKSILFLRDHDGDENHAIWRASLDGSGAVNLTTDEVLRRDEPFLPLGTPGTIFYSASRTSDVVVRLFRLELAGGTPKVLYTQNVPGACGGVTPDGKRALMIEYASHDDITIREIDLATGAAHRVYPAEGKKTDVSDVAYAADGARVFLTTYENGEKSSLLALDPATGKELGRYSDEGLPTAPTTPYVAPKGNRIVVRTDAGNHGELKILDAKTLKLVRQVKLPVGDVLGGSFRDDGKELSLIISLPTQPADVFALDLDSGAVRPLRADKRAGLDGLPPLEAEIRNAPAFDGLTIPINQYLPRFDRPKKVPTIAIFHGGPATSYAVRWNPYARFFVSLGYAVIEPNVRGSSGFGHAYVNADDREKRADWLKDVETVNAWAKAQAWSDDDRIVVWGQSYGGYTTLMALTRQPALWRAGVDLYGVADLRKFMLTTSAEIRSALTSEFGDPDKDKDLLERFSPMRDVDKITAPLFVYAGQNDPRVPRSESDAIVRALRDRKVPVEYMVAANEGHTVDRRETKIELLTRTARFLEDALK